MKRKRFTTEQIIGVLKKAEGGMPVKELCRKYSSAMQMFSKFGGTVNGASSLAAEFTQLNRCRRALIRTPAVD